MKTNIYRYYHRRLKSLGKDGRYYKNIAEMLTGYISERFSESVTINAYKYKHTYEVHLQDIGKCTIFWGGYFKDEKYAWRSFCEDVIGIGECGSDFCLNEYLIDKTGNKCNLLPINLTTIAELEHFLKSK